MSQLPREYAAKNTHKVVAKLTLSDKSCSKIVDIPCGSGAFTQRMMHEKMEVHPVDCVNYLEVKSEHFRCGNMNDRLDFSAGSFDAVTSIDGIEHIEKPFEFIRECHRILKSDGRLIISTPNISSLRSRWRWFLTGFHNKCKAPLDEKKPDPYHHINMISYPELRYMLHTNGFQIEEIETNRIKKVSLLYSFWVPVCFLLSFWSLYQESKRVGDFSLSWTILKQLYTPNLLFGETMIVAARRQTV